jgi:sortase (surface protein transpeptidase)
VSTTPNGELDVPPNPKVVGWWSPGAKPGARTGTAILAGHINYAGVAGTLAKIGSLKPGDQVYVFGKDKGKKTEIKFRITGVRTYHKTRLPYKEIFDQKSIGRIAIVTCGGPFDASTGNYLDNIVAFGVPIAGASA